LAPGTNTGCTLQAFWQFGELSDQVIDGLTILNPAQLAALPSIQNSVANTVDPDELAGDDAQETSDDAPPVLQLQTMALPGTDTTIAVGDRITYVITISNTENLAEGVVISASLSANLQLDTETITPPLLIVSGDVAAADQMVQPPLRWSLDSLPSGGHFQAQFVVVVRDPGDANSTIQASAEGTTIQTMHLHHTASTPTGNTDTLQRIYLPIVQQ